MINPVLGGVLIGLAVSLMLLFNGRVTGISGILGDVFKGESKDKAWRLYFLAGLLLGGVILRMFSPESLALISSATSIDYAIAGLLVGIGTMLGKGCTSGHGVCGLSRLSMRSFIATVCFMLSGVISVMIFKILKGSL